MWRDRPGKGAPQIELEMSAGLARTTKSRPRFLFLFLLSVLCLELASGAAITGSISKPRYRQLLEDVEDQAIDQADDQAIDPAIDQADDHADDQADEELQTRDPWCTFERWRQLIRCDAGTGES